MKPEGSFQHPFSPARLYLLDTWQCSLCHPRGCCNRLSIPEPHPAPGLSSGTQPRWANTAPAGSGGCTGTLCLSPRCHHRGGSSPAQHHICSLGKRARKRKLLKGNWQKLQRNFRHWHRVVSPSLQRQKSPVGWWHLGTGVGMAALGDLRGLLRHDSTTTLMTLMTLMTLIST